MPFSSPFSSPRRGGNASESESDREIRPTASSDTDDSAVAALGALNSPPALGRMDDDTADDLPVSMSSTSLISGIIPTTPGLEDADDEMPVSMSSTSLFAGTMPTSPDDDDKELPQSMSGTSLLTGSIPDDNDSDEANATMPTIPGSPADKSPAKKQEDPPGDDKNLSVFGREGSQNTAAAMGLGAAVAAKNKEAGIDPKKVDTEKKAAAAALKDDDESRVSVFDSIRAGAAGAAAALGLGAAVAAKNEQDAAAAAAAAADATEEAKVAEEDSSVNEDTAVTAAAPAADEDSVVMGSNPVRGAPETPKSIKTVPLSEEAKREQRSKLCKYGVFAALLLIVVAVGLGLGLSRRDDGSRGITTMAPTAAPEPGAPTAEPIVPAGPTAAPTSSPTVSAFDILLSYLASISPDGGAALEDPSSPQYQAAEWLFTNPGLSGYTETEINQRYALATIYLATDGDNWRLNNDWLDPELSECQWIGIGCEAQPASGRKLREDESSTTASLRGKNANEAKNKQRRTQALVFVVKKVQLFELALSGPLPSEIAILTETKDISCYGNSITGPIPDAIGDIAGLEILQLDGNFMTGTLPSSVFDLTALTKVRLETNEFTGTVPDTISQLSNLVDFRVENNMLTGEINPDICANDLERLSSDCAGDPPEIECSCCTQCFDGTEETPDGRQA